MHGTDKRISGTEATECRTKRSKAKCLYAKSKGNDYKKGGLLCQINGCFLSEYHYQRTENKMGKLQ